MRGKGARSLYALSASVNSAVADERVLIVNLRFMEEARKVKKAHWCAQPRPGVLSCRR